MNLIEKVSCLEHITDPEDYESLAMLSAISAVGLLAASQLISYRPMKLAAAITSGSAVSLSVWAGRKGTGIRDREVELIDEATYVPQAWVDNK